MQLLLGYNPILLLAIRIFWCLVCISIYAYLYDLYPDYVLKIASAIQDDPLLLINPCLITIILSLSTHIYRAGIHQDFAKFVVDIGEQIRVEYFEPVYPCILGISVFIFAIVYIEGLYNDIPDFFINMAVVLRANPRRLGRRVIALL